MNPYIQIILLSTLLISVFAIFSCQRKYGSNIICYIAFFWLGIYANLLAVNIFYTVQNYKLYLENTKELGIVLAGVGIGDILFIFGLMKLLKLKTIKTYYAPVLLVSLILFNGYYLFKTV